MLNRVENRDYFYMDDLKRALYDTLLLGYPISNHPRFIPKIGETNTEQSLESLKETLLSTFNRSLKGVSDVILPLSGGLDSRLILACLLECLPANKIHAFTYGLDNHLDFDIPPLIAKKTGIHFTQVNLADISIQPNIINPQDYTLINTPAHNLIGFRITQTASKEALIKLDLNEKTPVWSGFFGDRIFTGLFSTQKQGLTDSCSAYIDQYKMTPLSFFPKHYNPAEKLITRYKEQQKPVNCTWLEWIDWEQRQSRVQSNLMTLDNPYYFPFAESEVITAILSFTASTRKNGQLQRQYFHEFHPDLAKLAVTSRFGYPMRKHSLFEQTDRLQRLLLTKIDSLLGTQCQPFQRKPITQERFAKKIEGYEETIRFGKGEAIKALSTLKIQGENNSFSAFTNNRTKNEGFASIGYLI